jgi:hypothetical protein
MVLFKSLSVLAINSSSFKYYSNVTPPEAGVSEEPPPLFILVMTSSSFIETSFNLEETLLILEELSFNFEETSLILEELSFNLEETSFNLEDVFWFDIVLLSIFYLSLVNVILILLIFVDMSVDTLSTTSFV